MSQQVEIPRLLDTRRVVLSDDLAVRVGGDDGVFLPRVRLSRWDECALDLRLVQDEPGIASVDQQAIVYTTPSLEARFYQLGIVGGGFEFAVFLNHKPQTNILRFQETLTEAESWAQPALANVDASGDTWEENGRGGRRMRPAHIVDSLAYYGVQRAGNYEAVGGKNYRAGKVCHLHRAWARDAVGHQVWCGFARVDGELRVVVPWEFLESAIYPVMVDPTFGYTTHGGSQDDSGDTITGLYAKAFGTPASAGTLDSVTAYVGSSGTSHLNPALYTDTSGSPVTRLAFLNTGGTAVTTFAEYTQALAYASLVSGTQYQLGFSPETAVIQWKFDTTGGTELHYANIGNSWPATASGLGSTDQRVSIWGNYTASGGPLAIPAGSLAVTGNAASVVVGVARAIPAGSLAFTGNAAILKNVLTTPAGSLAATGNAAALSITGAAITRAIPAGSLAVTGNAASLSIGAGSPVTRAIPAGSLAITGQYVATAELDAAAGALVLTGNAAALKFVLPVPIGSLAVTGNAASVRVDVPRAMVVGAVTVTGNAPILRFVLVVPVGSLAITGQMPAVSIGAGTNTIAIPAGTLAITGEYVAEAFIDASPGALTITGLAAAVYVNNTTIAIPVGSLAITGAYVAEAFIDAASGTLTLTGWVPTVSTIGTNTNIAIPAGSLTVTGNAASIQIGVPYALVVGAVAFTGNAGILRFVLPVPVGALTITGQIPNVSVSTATNTNYSTPAGSLTITGTASILAFRLSVPAGSVVLTGTASALGVGVSVPAAALSVTGLAASFAWRLTPPAGVLAVTGLVPSLGLVLGVPVGALTITGQVVAFAGRLTPPAAALAVTGLAATLGWSVSIPAGGLTVTGQAGAVQNGKLIQVPVGSLAVTGNGSALAWVVGVPVGSLVLAGQTGLLTGTGTLATPAGSVTVAGLAAALQFGAILRPDAAALAMSGMLPTVATGFMLVMEAGVLEFAGFVPELIFGNSEAVIRLSRDGLIAPMMFSDDEFIPL